jgi:hypothetical protein
MGSGLLELDFIEELRLRRWARENYVPPDRRERSWHPIVHDEMVKKDTEKRGMTVGASRFSPR